MGGGYWGVGGGDFALLMGPMWCRGTVWLFWC